MLRQDPPPLDWPGYCPFCGSNGAKSKKANRMMRDDEVIYECFVCCGKFRVHVSRVPYRIAKEDVYIANHPNSHGFKKAKKKTVQLQWRKVMRSQPCHYCGENGGTIDHKIPTSRGGQDTRDNCVPSCGPCNVFKGDRSYEAFKAGDWKARPFSGTKMALGGY